MLSLCAKTTYRLTRNPIKCFLFVLKPLADLTGISLGRVKLKVGFDSARAYNLLEIGKKHTQTFFALNAVYFCLKSSLPQIIRYFNINTTHPHPHTDIPTRGGGYAPPLWYTNAPEEVHTLTYTHTHTQTNKHSHTQTHQNCGTSTF